MGRRHLPAGLGRRVEAVLRRLDGDAFLASAPARARAGSAQSRGWPGSSPSYASTSGGRRTGPSTSRGRPSRASTGSRSRTGPTSARTSTASSNASWATSSPTVDGTAGRSTAQPCRRSTRRSACSRASSNGSTPAGPRRRVAAARRAGEEYLLERRLFRRRSTGQVIDPRFTMFSFPTRWYYDVLRGLDYFRATGASPGRPRRRCGRARRRQARRGRPLAAREHPPGADPLRDGGPEGFPSRWNTLRALASAPMGRLRGGIQGSGRRRLTQKIRDRGQHQQTRRSSSRQMDATRAFGGRFPTDARHTSVGHGIPARSSPREQMARPEHAAAARPRSDRRGRRQSRGSRRDECSPDVHLTRTANIEPVLAGPVTSHRGGGPQLEPFVGAVREFAPDRE